MAMWSIALPMDVVKSRYQGAPNGTYTGFLQCFRLTLAQEGAAGLFKGATPALLRAFPANAATFVSVSQSREVLHALMTIDLSINLLAWCRIEHQGDEYDVLGNRIFAYRLSSPIVLSQQEHSLINVDLQDNSLSEGIGVEPIAI